MKNIVLVGYMGSGKSLIGSLLSKRLNINCLDLDDVIVQKEKKSITEIFETKGELYFRKLENSLFNELISSKENEIICTGGGTPCYYENYKILEKDTVFSIYLKAGINTLQNRLTNEIHKRPLLQNLKEEQLYDYIAKSLFERSYYYYKSKLVIDTDGKSGNEIVEEILINLANFGIHII